MLMCEQSWVITPELVAAFEQWVAGDPPAGWRLPIPQPLACLGWLPRAICLPHFHLTFTQLLLERGALPTGFTLIGVEEQTALVQKDTAWEVRGRGAVTLIHDDLKPVRYATGETLNL
jgi:cyanophycinase-like exopeptidase